MEVKGIKAVTKDLHKSSRMVNCTEGCVNVANPISSFMMLLFTVCLFIVFVYC